MHDPLEEPLTQHSLPKSALHVMAALDEVWGWHHDPAGVSEPDVLPPCVAGKPATLRRVSEAWVPELQRLGVRVPLLLVGCKSDLRPAGQNLHQARLLSSVPGIYHTFVYKIK